MNPMPERHQKVYFKTMALMHSVTYDKLKVSQWFQEGKLMLKCKFDQKDRQVTAQNLKWLGNGHGIIYLVATPIYEI